MDQKTKIKLAGKVALISGVFCLFVALLLLLNYWHIRSNEPLESEALKTLVERLNAEPNREQLKQEIRNLDLLARKAYFTSWWQVKTGGYLLLIGAIFGGVALRVYYSLQAKIEVPKDNSAQDEDSRLLSQKWLISVGGLIFLLALGASLMSKNYLNTYSFVAETSVEQVKLPEEETVEVISIHKSSLPEEKTQQQPVSDLEKKASVESSEEDVSANEKMSAPMQGKKEVPAEKKPEPKPISAETGFPGYEELVKQSNNFRGVLGNGVSFRTNIPVDWDGVVQRNILWKTEVPKPGFNSPVIWGDKLFISGGDKQMRMVYCFDRHSGKILWEREVNDIPGSPATPPKVTEDTGLSAPSLAVDGQRVFAIFATGDLIAFDLEGKRLWAKNLGVPDNHYGHSSSLLVWQDKLFIQFDTNNGGRMLAVNTASGEIIWDIQRPVNISWSSPVLMKAGDQYQIITSADPNVAAYDPETGKELWAVECMMGEVGPSPAFGEGLVFAANEYAKLAAIKPGPSPEIVWENNEYLPEVASPVVSNGLLFIATSYGVLVCYDAKNGEKYWEKDFGVGFYASPVVADGKLYAMDMDGTMHILKVDKDGILIGEPRLGEKAFATPAFAQGRIYLRGEKHLFCIGEN